MDKKLEILQVESVKELLLEHIKIPALHFVVGYINDIQKYGVVTRLVSGLYGYGGLAQMDNGELSRHVFENNDSDYIEDFDVYSVHVIEGNTADLVIVGDEVNHFGDSEYGSRYTFNFEEKTYTIATMLASEAFSYLRKSQNPKEHASFVKLYERAEVREEETDASIHESKEFVPSEMQAEFDANFYFEIVPE